MTSEQKQAFWQSHLEGWRQSRLSQRDYCQQHGLAYTSFGYWRGRINRRLPPDNKLIPVKLAEPQVSVRIFLPGGIRLEVPTQALAEILPMIYRTVPVC